MKFFGEACSALDPSTLPLTVFESRQQPRYPSAEQSKKNSRSNNNIAINVQNQNPCLAAFSLFSFKTVTKVVGFNCTYDTIQTTKELDTMKKSQEDFYFVVVVKKKIIIIIMVVPNINLIISIINHNNK